MGFGPAAILLTPYTVDPDTVRGGAQRVAAEICDRLTEQDWTVQVIESPAWRGTIDPLEPFVSGMAGHAATTRTWRAAVPSAAITAADAGEAVRKARLVLVLDRSVGRLDTSAHRVLLLSNLVYENERLAAECGDHDVVWVPSEYLARLLTATNSGARVNVHVVPPALVEARCTAKAHEPLHELDARLTAMGVPRDRRLIFPHRADPGKGLTTALKILKCLLKETNWVVIGVRQVESEDSDAGGLVDQALLNASGIADHVFWTPWLPQQETPCLYGLGGVTLMPTTLQEGFGLVAVESLACGVPVVARPVGNLRLLAARFASIYLAEDVHDMVSAVTTISGSPVSPEHRRAVCEAFSVARQRNALTAALAAIGA